MLQAKTGNTSAQSFMGEVSSSSIATSLLYFATNTQKGQAEEVMDATNRIFLFAFARIRCKLAGARRKTRLRGCGELHFLKYLQRIWKLAAHLSTAADHSRVQSFDKESKILEKSWFFEI